MGWFDDAGYFSSRSRAERAELKKAKDVQKKRQQALKSVKVATSRDKQIAKLKAKTDVYRDEERLEKAKRAYQKAKYPSVNIKIKKLKKKKQGRPLSRRGAIRLI